MNHLIVIQNGNEIETNSIDGCKIEWLGNNGEIKIHAPFKFTNSTLQVGNNSTIEIKQNSQIKNLFLRCASDDSFVNIGENFIMESGQIILAKGMKKQSLTIGKNCLFSSEIFIQTSDGHAIFDNKGKIINLIGGNISIGDHVWLGHNVSILKKAQIPNDCVVAEKSTITKPFSKKNCILGGVPAKIIKKNISWDIKSPAYYIKG